MHPPWSMILFTTLAGAGQGLLLALVGVDAAARLQGVAAPERGFFAAGTALVLLFCGAGLVAASFHLGRPLRAWRAASMWRTSWLSREVIVLPAFMALAVAWGGAQWAGASTLALGSAAGLLAAALYLCTGMIYAAVTVIREWATPLTPLSFAALGVASGLSLAAVLAAFAQPPLAGPLARLALAATVFAALLRGATLWRNATLAPKTSLQTAIGVRHPRIVQKSQGAMGGSFNTREFFHGRSPAFVRGMRVAMLSMAFALPIALLAASQGELGAIALSAVFFVQTLGLLAERWIFFADGRHPQNLYYGATR